MANECVSGCIFRQIDQYKPEGYSYKIIQPGGDMGWDLPVGNVTPDDLRALADELEERRKDIKG